MSLCFARQINGQLRHFSAINVLNTRVAVDICQSNGFAQSNEQSNREEF